MTVLSILAICGLALALLVCLALLWRVAPKVRLVQPETSPEARSRGVKRDILRARLERQMFDRAQVILRLGRGIWVHARDAFRRSAGRLVALERTYSSKKHGATPTGRSAAVRSLRDQAQSLINHGKLDAAEHILVQAVSLAPKDYDGYLALGDLLHSRGNEKDAQEAYRYAAKLAPKDPVPAFSLGSLFLDLHDEEGALAWLTKARDLEPQNPKYLDAVCRCAIALKRPKVAQSALKALQEVNPENGKLEDFAQEIAALTEE